jgi:hypothetical protein
MAEVEMKNHDMVWLASYPRSGNTFLRTILWQCFALHSGSMYPNDLEGNKVLESYVGHIEQGPGKEIRFPAGAIPLIKTHEQPRDSRRAIYVIRDGRAATASLWNFYKKSISLEAIIEGRTPFGTWSAHVSAWNPLERPDTLLLRYEDMKADLPHVLNRISEFIHCDIVKTSIPDRNAIAGQDGQWVRRESDWRSVLSGASLDRFMQINQEIMSRFGYLD